VYEREQLRRTLTRIDGRPYGAYADLTGAYDYGRFTLFVEHVQPDPYAPPSRLRAVVPASATGLTPVHWRSSTSRVALEDWLLRRLHQAVARAAGGAAPAGPPGAEAGGAAAASSPLPASCLRLLVPGPQVLERSAVAVRAGEVEVRLGCELPASRRTVWAPRAAAALDVALPAALEAMLPASPTDWASLAAHIALHEDQAALREALRRRGWVAFLADGSTLPRESGWSELPLRGEGVVRLRAPDALAATVHLPHRGEVRGLAIPEGVTLIVGGAYHGKSTLLRALEQGVYDHVAGDGRELCASRATTVTVAAEDGRPVSGVDISFFVRPLPGGSDTRRFRTLAASGSTSQASALVEAVEGGADCLLLDEDRSAANFLSRDARMRALVPDAEDPVAPFAERVRQLWERAGVSSVIVVGGAGALLDCADRVIRMRAYLPEDATAAAQGVCRLIPAPAPAAEGVPLTLPPSPRVPAADTFPAAVRARPRPPRAIAWDEHVIELGAQSQLVDLGQLRALADMLPRAAAYADGGRSLAEIVAEVFADIGRLGWQAISPWPGQCPGDYVLPRPLELLAALNRFPGLRLAGEPEAAGPRRRPVPRVRLPERPADGGPRSGGRGRPLRPGARPPGAGRARASGRNQPQGTGRAPGAGPLRGSRGQAAGGPPPATARGRPLQPAAAVLRNLRPRAERPGAPGRERTAPGPGPTPAPSGPGSGD
jgi:predicted ABC-class ATPase